MADVRERHYQLGETICPGCEDSTWGVDGCEVIQQAARADRAEADAARLYSALEKQTTRFKRLAYKPAPYVANALEAHVVLIGGEGRMQAGRIE